MVGFHQRRNACQDFCIFFPAGEYGYLKGTVNNIGADALEVLIGSLLIVSVRTLPDDN